MAKIVDSSFLKSCSFFCLALGLSTGFAGQASTQTGQPADGDQDRLDEIVVTAQRRAENLLKIPLAVTAFSPADLQKRGVADMTDLSTAMSGLVISRAGGILLPYLRGVGNSNITIGGSSSVAVYVDGIYYARVPDGLFSTSNLERVEVLKGPQGTLFGRSSSGGVIQFITKEPSYNIGGSISINYGNYGTWQNSAYFTTGVTDRIATDLSVSGRYQRKGYGTNIPTGNRATYNDSFNIRNKWLFDIGDNTRATLTAFYGYIKTDIQGNTWPGTTHGFLSAPNTQPILPVGYYDHIIDEDGFQREKVWGGSLHFEHELPFAAFKSTSSYLKSKYLSLFDTDYTPRPDRTATLRGGVETVTQELQLSSLPGAPVKWVGGLYYFNGLTEYHDLSFEGLGYAFAPAGFSAFAKQRAKSYAAYGQASYEIVPRLTVTGGIRYTKDDTDGSGYLQANATGVVFSRPTPATQKYNRWNFRGAVDFQLTPSALLYASYSSGYKSGHFNLLTYQPTPVKPEDMDAYEVGAKLELLDRRLRITGSLFQYDIKNPQVLLIVATLVNTSNAESSRVKGAELEMQALLAPGLNARLAFTYLDSYYKKYTAAPSGAPNPNPPFGSISPLASIDASGNPTPRSPKLTVNAGLDYTVPTAVGDLTLGIDYFHSAKFYFEPDLFLKQKGYDLVGAQARLRLTKNLAVGIWGKNLLNEKYANFAVTSAGFTGYQYVAAAPRTYGLSVDLAF
ncbi:TonB-dependent receptor [Sphingomonadaceae bacterium G21617-S1]|nr:TonB-dependent receptor [Sphingomonadaceae bacterium G21617-S1]